MYVTTNLTHTQLSVEKKGIAGKPKSTNEQSITINAADKDSITFQTLLKFANKFERHPLFLKEFAYTIGYRAPYRGTPYFHAAPGGSFIEIQTQNTTNKYVTAMLLYNGKEDSLFTLDPISAKTEFQTIGYFKIAYTLIMRNPLVKFYFGQNPPFKTTISTLPLWGSGASPAVSASELYIRNAANPQIYIPIKQ